MSKFNWDDSDSDDGGDEKPPSLWLTHSTASHQAYTGADMDLSASLPPSRFLTFGGATRPAGMALGEPECVVFAVAGPVTPVVTALILKEHTRVEFQAMPQVLFVLSSSIARQWDEWAKQSFVTMVLVVHLSDAAWGQFTDPSFHSFAEKHKLIASEAHLLEKALGLKELELIRQHVDASASAKRCVNTFLQDSKDADPVRVRGNVFLTMQQAQFTCFVDQAILFPVALRKVCESLGLRLTDEKFDFTLKVVDEKYKIQPADKRENVFLLFLLMHSGQHGSEAPSEGPVQDEAVRCGLRNFDVVTCSRTSSNREAALRVGLLNAKQNFMTLSTTLSERLMDQHLKKRAGIASTETADALVLKTMRNLRGLKEVTGVPM